MAAVSPLLRNVMVLTFSAGVAYNFLHWTFPGDTVPKTNHDQEGHASLRDVNALMDDLGIPESARPPCDSPKQCLEALSSLPLLDLDEHGRRRLQELSGDVQRKLVMDRWLQANGWSSLIHPLSKAGIASLGQVARMDLDAMAESHHLSKAVLAELSSAQEYLPDDQEGIDSLERLVTAQLEDSWPRRKSSDRSVRASGGAGAFLSAGVAIFVSLLVFWLMWDLGLTPSEVVWGAPLYKSFTSIKWPVDVTASTTKTISISFYDMRGRALDVSEKLSSLVPEAWHQHRRVNAFVSSSGDGLDQRHVVHLTFTSRASGRYYISLRSDGYLIRGFPALTLVDPGRVEPKKTVLVGMKASTLVLTAELPETIQIDPKDAYGNSIPKQRLPSLAGRFNLKILEKLGDPVRSVSRSSPEINTNFVVYHTPVMVPLCASMAFGSGQEGWYRASITLDSVSIGNGELTLIVLSRSDRNKVNRLVEAGYDNLPSFEGELVAESGALSAKPKTVWCSLTSKQLTVRDYVLKIFPRKLYNFRMAPSTKVLLTRYAGANSRVPVLSLRDGFQGDPEILMKSGNVFAACFHLMLLHKLGGSESFCDKQAFFNSKLLRHHQSRGNKHTRLLLKIDRADIVGSSYKATRWFTESDWCRLFEVEFLGEIGIDQGGVSIASYVYYQQHSFKNSSCRYGESGLKCCARHFSIRNWASLPRWRRIQKQSILTPMEDL